MDRKALVAALVAIAIGSAGCGGGDSALTQGELVKRAGAVCTQMFGSARVVLQAHPRFEATQRADINRIGQRAIRELRQLPPPRAVSATYDRYVAALRAAIDATTSEISQSRAGQQHRNETARLVVVLAQRLGLKGC